MKKRVRRGDPERRAYWEATVRRWREGGQAVRAFCRAEGLRESAFYFWRRELTRCGLRIRKRTATVAPEHSAGPSFLPVHVVAPKANGADVREAFHGVEIVLARGGAPAQRVAVRVGTGFDRQTLAEVLAVLEARPC